MMNCNFYLYISEGLIIALVIAMIATYFIVALAGENEKTTKPLPKLP